MVSYILMSLFVTIISLCLGGIPIIVFLIMLESGGLIDYTLAFTLLLASVFELIKFVFFLTSDRVVKLSIKDIFTSIKSLLKKEKKENQNKESQSKTAPKFKIFQVVFVLLFVVIAIFHKPHSMLLNVIYDNLIVRILYYIFIPLVICDLINQIKDGVIDGIGEFISGIIMSVGIPCLFGIILSTSFIFTSKIMYEDILEYKIKTLFVYDNRDYDEARKEKDFISEFDYLKNAFEESLNELKEKNDINDKYGIDKIRREVLLNANISRCGYQVTDKEWNENDSLIFCVVDLKTRDFKIYKYNIKENIFELSSMDEFETLRKTNYENK